MYCYEEEHSNSSLMLLSPTVVYFLTNNIFNINLDPLKPTKIISTFLNGLNILRAKQYMTISNQYCLNIYLEFN